MKWLRPGVRVALIGDSQMQGMGQRLARLLQQHGVSVPLVEARSGWSTRGYLQSGDIPALTRGVDVAVIELGGNDAAGNISPEAHALDVASLLHQVAAAQVVWVGPSVSSDPAFERRRQQMREAQQRVLSRAGKPWISGASLTRVADLNDSGVHFTPVGYDRFAAGLAEALLRLPGGIGWESWVGPLAAGGAAAVALGAAGWYFTRRRR